MTHINSSIQSMIDVQERLLEERKLELRRAENEHLGDIRRWAKRDLQYCKVNRVNGRKGWMQHEQARLSFQDEEVKELQDDVDAREANLVKLRAKLIPVASAQSTSLSSNPNPNNEKLDTPLYPTQTPHQAKAATDKLEKQKQERINMGKLAASAEAERVMKLYKSKIAQVIKNKDEKKQADKSSQDFTNPIIANIERQIVEKKQDLAEGLRQHVANEIKWHDRPRSWRQSKKVWILSEKRRVADGNEIIQEYRDELAQLEKRLVGLQSQPQSSGQNTSIPVACPPKSESNINNKNSTDKKPNTPLHNEPVPQEMKEVIPKIEKEKQADKESPDTEESVSILIRNLIKTVKQEIIRIGKIAIRRMKRRAIQKAKQLLNDAKDSFIGFFSWNVRT